MEPHENPRYIKLREVLIEKFYTFKDNEPKWNFTEDSPLDEVLREIAEYWADAALDAMGAEYAGRVCKHISLDCSFCDSAEHNIPLFAAKKLRTE